MTDITAHWTPKSQVAISVGPALLLLQPQEATELVDAMESAGEYAHAGKLEVSRNPCGWALLVRPASLHLTAAEGAVLIWAVKRALSAGQTEEAAA